MRWLIIGAALLVAGAAARAHPIGNNGWNTGPTIVTMATDAYSTGNSGVSNASFIGKNQLATFNGKQYLCYYNSTFNPKIAVRTLATNAVTVTNPGLPAIENPDGDGQNDVHKICSITLDSTGFIHLSYGQHSAPLVYYLSNNAQDPSAFTAVTQPLVNSTVETLVTYPMFVKNPSTGALYFTFRSGYAGDGDQYLYAYNTGTKTFSAASGTGTNGIIISGKTCVTTLYSAYLNGLPKWDSSNNLWFQWQFNANTPASCSFTSNLPYGQNEYLMEWTGSAFKNVSGTTLTMPVTYTTAPEILALAETTNLYNQNDFAIDQSSGAFYIVYPHQDGGGFWQTYALTNFSGSFIEKVLTTNASTNPCIGGDQGTVLVKSGTAYAVYPNGYAGVFGPPTIAVKSSNGYTSFTPEGVMQLMNVNNALAPDPDRLPSGIMSVPFMNWDVGWQGGGCTYPIPDAGTMYVVDWTIQ